MKNFFGRLLIALLCSVCFSSAHAQESATTETPLQEYLHGRFRVVEFSDRQEIIGGEFTPNVFMPQIPSAKLAGTGKSPKHVVFINYSTKELQYYHREEAGVYRPIIGYAVITPEPSELPREVVRGVVSRIVKDPTWCPLPGGEIRRDDPTLPPGCFPPGHPRNAMGGYRFDITWDVPRWSLIKLHGSNGYPRHFETVITYGCTRVTDLELEKLVGLLGPKAVEEGIEVIAHRSARSLRSLGE